MIIRLRFLVAVASIAAAYVVKTLKLSDVHKPSELGQEFDEKLHKEGGDTTHDEIVFTGMAEWASLPRDVLVLIARHIEFFEDFCKFSAVCKSWHSVTSILGKCQSLPSKFPWIMLTDKAEINYPKVTRGLDIGVMLIGEVRKNEQIEGMHNRQFYSFAASKVYEFELPEATRKKCLGVGYGLLLTLDYDLQINILNPFTRQQIGMPNMLSFKSHYNYADQNRSPQQFIEFFIVKVAISSNPYKSSNQDCIIMAIYGPRQVLAFARPGDRVWTDVYIDCETRYVDVVYCNGKFYAVDKEGIINVCDINDANKSKVTPIACLSEYTYYKVYRKYYYGYDRKYHYGYRKYLVELSGDLLLVIRFRNGEYYDDKKDNSRPYNYTVGFLIFKLEECCGDYPYKLTKVNNLGNNALFIGNNASVSVPSSKFVKANSIYFSDDEAMANNWQPYGGGYDTGIYDVKSGNISLHDYASKFMSLLTPPMWIIT